MSIIYEDFYNQDNIGKLVKYKAKDFGNKEKILYGRYYGRGYEGKSNYYDYDYDVITFITPHGLLVNVEKDFPEPIIDSSEMNNIIKSEKKIRNPYYPFFTLRRDGSIIKIYDFTKLDLKLKYHSNKWFEDNGYLIIDSKLFGINLAQLFSLLVHPDYKLYDITSDVNYINADSKSSNGRRFLVISKNEYSNFQFNIDTTYPNTKENDNGTTFCTNHLKLGTDDFLIYFGNTYDKYISLGSIKYGKFIPNNFNPFNNSAYSNEILYNNAKYNFVETFMKEIMKYKIKAKKTILTQSDMNNILTDYLIDKKDKIQAIEDLFKQTETQVKYETLNNSKVLKIKSNIK